jgi:predicted PurR-regulated permease PerM
MKLQAAAAENSMTTFCLSRLLICRVIAVIVGVAVFWLGVRVGGFWGLLLTIVGIVPAVIGAGGVSLLSEIPHERAESPALD